MRRPDARIKRWASIAPRSSACWALSLLAAAALLTAGGCRATLDRPSAHTPFTAHACGSCHDTEGSLSFGVYPTTFSLPKPPRGSQLEPTLDDQTKARLRVRVDQLCFQCHKSLDPESPPMRGLWLHGPFKAGVCVGCHDPHQSTHRRLLAAYPWQNLCSRCHPDFHDGKGTAAFSLQCQSCHSPHAQREPPKRPAGADGAAKGE